MLAVSPNTTLGEAARAESPRKEVRDLRIDVNAAKADEVTVSLPYRDVAKIEVERIICPTKDEGFDTHYRTIRITTTGEEVLELSLEAEDDENLMVREVDVLPPVKKRRARKDTFDWLTPKVVKKRGTQK